MKPVRRSQQRDAIHKELQMRRDHPTADELYFALKDHWPALSLGTVYRNLGQLCEAGLAQRVPGNGVEHFDATVHPHPHVVCHCCGRMFDLHLPSELHTELLKQAEPFFEGKLDELLLRYGGICAACAKPAATP
ncbi:MAG: transcriptional repressor [Oscillospiraceae bacterium]|jgi:Fur family peroxide stress response transcriptional regulator|nr:transcriptional repressor [Oscillospiraceae bacterium]